MIIKKIEIRNFRSYYRDNTFELSPGLTLIIGDNGDGKTTFFEALQWLFNTTVDTPNIENFSEKRKAELELGESDMMSVSMTFDHYGTKVIEKYFLLERYAKDRFRPSTQIFRGYEERNSERIQVDGKTLVANCFDAFIQKFSMFKGESDLNVFNDPEALQQLVSKFSDLRQFQIYVDHVTEFERKSNLAFIKESKSDTKISRQIEELDNQLIEVNQTLSYYEGELRSVEKAASIYQKNIDELEKHKESSEKYMEIKKRLEAKRSEETRFKGLIAAINFNYGLLDSLWILSNFPAILKEFQDKATAFSLEKRVQNDQFIKDLAKEEGKREALEEITQLVNGSARLPWYLPNEETMEEMIQDEICKVCGRPALRGSEAYHFMCEKLEEYRKHALAETEAKKTEEAVKKELFINQFIEEIHNLSLELGGYNETEIRGKAKEIKDKMGLVDSYKRKLESIQTDIAEMQDEKSRILIQSEGLTDELLDKSFHDLKGFFEQKGIAEKKAEELKHEIGRLRDNQEYLKEQINNLAPGKGQVGVYKRVHMAFEKILGAFIRAKENNLIMFLESLEDRANHYQAKLNANDFHGIVKLIRTADNSAVIKLYSSNGSEIRKPSGSQQTTMYMSVLFAISDLTTLRREEDYPLIFDAATSSFGDTKEEDFYNIIDHIQKQCIIVTKDFLDRGVLRNDDINKLTCSVYRIKKAEGYDSHDLSTIRTTVLKVK